MSEKLECCVTKMNSLKLKKFISLIDITNFATKFEDTRSRYTSITFGLYWGMIYSCENGKNINFVYILS